MEFVEVVVDSIRVSLMSPQRIIILRELDSDRFLPIWIGPFEADAITLSLQELAGYLIRGEDRGGGAEFRAHIGYRRSLGHAERSQAWSAVFQRLAHSPTDRQLLQ